MGDTDKEDSITDTISDSLKGVNFELCEDCKHEYRRPVRVFLGLGERSVSYEVYEYDNQLYQFGIVEYEKGASFEDSSTYALEHAIKSSAFNGKVEIGGYWVYLNEFYHWNKSVSDIRFPAYTWASENYVLFAVPYDNYDVTYKERFTKFALERLDDYPADYCQKIDLSCMPNCELAQGKLVCS